MLSKQVNAMPQKPAVALLSALEKHLSWALERRNEEHVSFPNFVVKFRFYDKADAHQAYTNLLNSGKIAKARLKILNSDYEHFKNNTDDIFWSRRLLNKSSKLTISNASVKVQEAGLEQVGPNLQRHIDRHRLKDYMVDSQRRDEGTRTKVSDDIDAGVLSEDSQDIEPISDNEELDDLKEIVAGSKLSPFLPLLEYLYKKVQGQNAALPPVPHNFICQEYKELYLYAHNTLMSRDHNRSRNRAYHVDKEVLVALSGIVNTVSPSTRAFTFASALKDDSVVAALDEKDDAITELMSELLETYCPGYKEDSLAPLNMWSLRTKVWSMLGGLGPTSPTTRDMRQRMAVLQIVDYICTLISTNQLSPPMTEHVVVSVWAHILAVLFGGQVVRGIPGELASAAARDVRLYVESTHGVTTKSLQGRKVDISVRVFANGHWNNEICIFEFKVGTASESVCAKQQLKAVRLNTAILHDLELKGVDTCKHYPIIAEGRGLCLNFYTLKRHGNIIAAGKSTNNVVWIPADLVQLKQFLKSNSMQVLLKFADHTSRYAVHVQETLSSIPLPPLPTTPPLRYTKPFAVFTPSKHNKRKRTDEADEEEVEDQDEEEDLIYSHISI